LTPDQDYIFENSLVCEICVVSFETQKKEYLKNKATQDEKEAREK